jgi:hypothetical protein
MEEEPSWPEPPSEALLAMTDVIYRRCIATRRRSLLRMGHQTGRAEPNTAGFREVIADVSWLVLELGIYDAELDQWLLDAEHDQQIS